MTTERHAKTPAEAGFNQHHQNILDEALAQTFPASDPVAMPNFRTPDSSDDLAARKDRGDEKKGSGASATKLQ